jgi:hypothetical protein
VVFGASLRRIVKMTTILGILSVVIALFVGSSLLAITSSKRDLEKMLTDRAEIRRTLDVIGWQANDVSSSR